MRLVLFILIVMGGAMFHTGCDRSPSTQEEVTGSRTATFPAPYQLAIIDLDKVARQMDWFDDMQRRVGALEQEMQVKLEGLRVQLETTLRDEQNRMSNTPTQEMKDRLEAMRLVAQRKLQEAQNQAQLETAKLREELVIRYRDLVRPIAQRIAQSKGIGIILLPSDMVFWNESALDMTQAVVEELKRLGVSPTQASADSDAMESAKP